MIIEQVEAIKSNMNPRFTIPLKMLKEAEDWKVGGEYELKMEVCQKAVRETPAGEVEITFEIKGMSTDIVQTSKSLAERVRNIENEYDTA